MNAKRTILYTIMHLKRILYFVIIIAAFFILHNLAQSLYTVWQKKDLILEAQHTLEREKKENREMKAKLAQAKGQDFVEEEARDKLFMAKPGEKILIIPTSAVEGAKSSKPKPKDMRPNWQKWQEVFFNEGKE